MADGKKTYLGITTNKGFFQGPVAEDPTFFEVEGGEGAMLKIKTVVPEFAANSQRIEHVHVVPIYVLDPAKARIVKSYVKEGKIVEVGTYYKMWPDGTGGLVLTYIQLGGNLYKPPEADAPGLPV